MSAPLIDLSQIITPEDWENMPRHQREGAEAFAAGHGLAQLGAGAQIVGLHHGWWRGWAVCYAMGVKAATEDESSEGGDADPNPFPQFSGPWEAWGEGWNTAPQMPGLGEVVPC